MRAVITQFFGGPIDGQTRIMPVGPVRGSIEHIPPAWVDVVTPTLGGTRTHRYVRSASSTVGDAPFWRYILREITFEAFA